MDRESLAELFASFGAVDVRRVFSGLGVYADDVCFALFLRGDLYLNADETTIPRFAAEGSVPFSYSTSTRTVSVNSYWTVPARLFDDPDELAQWSREALASATRRKLAKGRRKRASAKKSQRAKPAAKTISKREPSPSKRADRPPRAGTERRRGPH